MFGPPYALKAITKTSFKKMSRFIFFTLFVLLFAKMFKYNSYSLKISTTLVVAYSLLITLSSCGGKFSEEIKHVEELQAQLEANKENLNLDAPLFRLRAGHVETTLRTFRNDYKESMSKELGDNLSKYKNYKKIYMRSVRKHEESMKEQESLTQQLSNLLKSVRSGEISKDEFKVYYRTEKLDVDKLRQKSKEISKSLYEIEPEYIRLTAYFEPFLIALQP